MLATGVNKKVAYKKETSYGVVPSASGAKYIRRVTSTFNLFKENFCSNEFCSYYQVADERHGVRSVQGNISG